MFLSPTILPVGIVRMIENFLGLSRVQVDPNRPVAGCRMVLDPKAKRPVEVQCQKDPERWPAAQAQGLQCHVEPKVTLERGKTTLDFLVYCGPRSVAQDVKKAQAYFPPKIRVLREFEGEEAQRLHKFIKKMDPKVLERMKELILKNPHLLQKLPPRAYSNDFKMYDR